MNILEAEHALKEKIIEELKYLSEKYKMTLDASKVEVFQKINISVGYVIESFVNQGIIEHGNYHIYESANTLEVSFSKMPVINVIGRFKINLDDLSVHHNMDIYDELEKMLYNDKLK